MVKKYIDAGIEVARFLKSLKSLVDKNLIKSIDQAKAFAKQEFGEVSDLMTLQINKIFKTKNQPVVGKKTKDPVFDNTVQKLPMDDTGAPFNPNNPQKVYGKPKVNPNRMLDEDEIAELDMDIGGLEYTNDFDGTLASANKLRKERADYVADMELEYKKGNLDPVAGDKSPARKRFLEKKLEEMEMSGDTRLMSQDEIEELATFDLGTDMDKAVKKFKDETLENSIILNNFDPKGRKPSAKGGRIKMAKGGLPNILGY